MAHPSPGLEGTRLLVVTDREVDVNRLRRLGHVALVIVHRRDDGSYDPRVGDGFDAAVVSVDDASTDDALAYVAQRVPPGTPVEVNGTTTDVPAASPPRRRRLRIGRRA